MCDIGRLFEPQPVTLISLEVVHLVFVLCACRGTSHESLIHDMTAFRHGHAMVSMHTGGHGMQEVLSNAKGNRCMSQRRLNPDRSM